MARRINERLQKTSGAHDVLSSRKKSEEKNWVKFKSVKQEQERETANVCRRDGHEKREHTLIYLPTFSEI